jgi:predicted  nucleic acid-binding Zn-ribbon protein
MKLQEIEVQKSTISESFQRSSVESEQLKQQFTTVEYQRKSLMDQIESIESLKSAEIAELRINFETMEKKCRQLEEQVTKVEDEKRSLMADSEGKMGEIEANLEEERVERVRMEETMKEQELKFMVRFDDGDDDLMFERPLVCCSILLLDELIDVMTYMGF